MSAPTSPDLREPGVGRRREWWPDALVGAAVLVGGLVLEAGAGLGAVLVVVTTAVAAGLFRLAPGPALALVWLTALLQLVGGTTVSLAQLALVVVAFGTSRYGSTLTVWASGVSIPFGAGIAVLEVVVAGEGFAGTSWLLRPVVDGPGLLAAVGVGLLLVTALLAVPWAFGLVGRMRARAERSTEDHAAAEVGRRQAEEIARLREEQTRLARDVHDVVGHSLAVILAQAEAAQLRPPSDTGAVRAALQDITDSARQSLRDVREVLSSTRDAPTGEPPAAGLDALIEGVRAAGNPVRSSVVGSPRPLPPEAETVAFRVLQEMLTNALKHGVRGEEVRVERHWEGDLRLEVRNSVGPAATAPADDDTVPLAWGAPTGHGIDGMQRRLESVGGRLDVRRREEPGAGATYTATAWVPLRSGAG